MKEGVEERLVFGTISQRDIELLAPKNLAPGFRPRIGIRWAGGWTNWLAQWWQSLERSCCKVGGRRVAMKGVGRRESALRSALTALHRKAACASAAHACQQCC